MPGEIVLAWVLIGSWSIFEYGVVNAIGLNGFQTGVELVPQTCILEHGLARAGRENCVDGDRLARVDLLIQLACKVVQDAPVAHDDVHPLIEKQVVLDDLLRIFLVVGVLRGKQFETLPEDDTGILKRSDGVVRQVFDPLDLQFAVRQRHGYILVGDVRLGKITVAPDTFIHAEQHVELSGTLQHKPPCRWELLGLNGVAHRSKSLLHDLHFQTRFAALHDIGRLVEPHAHRQWLCHGCTGGERRSEA